MADILTIYRDGALAHEFDKRSALERMQFSYVQRMDAEMDGGVRLQGESIRSPNQTQRNQFVIGQLLDALDINDSRSIVMLCRYLARHVPELDSINIVEDGDEYQVDLIYS